MSFVRRKRGQVLLVHNERESGSGRIRQRVLHRFTSQAELEEALTPSGWARWTRALAWREPELTFEWPALRARLQEEQAAWGEAPSGATHRRDNKIERLAGELAGELAALTRAKASDLAALERARPSLEALRGSIERLIPSAGPQPGEAIGDKETDVEPRVSTSNPAAEALFDEGMDHWWAGKQRAAARLFRQALKLDPLHADAHNHLGIVSLESRRLKAAEAHFRAAVEGGQRDLAQDGARVPWARLENRPYLRGLANLALALGERKQWAEALAVHRRLLELDPEDNLGVRTMIGLECLRVGDLAGAVRALEVCQHEEVGCTFGLALARLHLEPQAEAVGEALLFGFAQNRYVAPMLLGEPWARLDGWHRSNMAEPEWAAEVVEAQADLWQAVPKGAEQLRFWWASAPVVTWRAALDDVLVRMQRAPLGDAQSALTAEWLHLTSPKRVLELVGRVRAAS